MNTKIIYFLYSLLSALALPFVLFYALLRVLRNGRYAATIGERLGFLPAAVGRRPGGAIWIHAVSVGEVIAAETLIARLRQHWTVPIYVSTTTLAGRETARQRLASVADGIFYAPIDYAGSVRRVLRRLEPSVVIILETEIWPNLFREAKRAGCGLAIVNGRMSDRAAPKYARARWFFRHVLGWPDAILVQTATDRERFLASGADAARVAIAGNLKYDFESRGLDAESPVAKWLAEGTGSLLIAASTTEDARVNEDAAILDAFEEELPGWRLILAPRKPERFDLVADLLCQRGLAFWRRSAGPITDPARILLLDSIGELSSLFGAADVVFMGGTLTETGGHNFLEAALAAKPVIVGPRLENFREIAKDFREHGAFLEISGAAELSAAIQRAGVDKEMGRRALARAEANRGATAVTVKCIQKLYGESLFRRPPTLPARVFLGPLAWLWRGGSRLKQARDLRRTPRLATPVISIGNITTGGTGKTPLVLRLAQRLAEQNFEAAVLTRGYGRVSHHQSLVLPRGCRASAFHTGDEPQILLRSGAAALGIAADRYAVGERVERELSPAVMLLDDGFSHLRLQRDVDIVLIDSLDPFGRWATVPLGRLREPLDALARADIFVITRCETGRPVDAIEHWLRRYNPLAPVFRSRLAPRGWVPVIAAASGAASPGQAVAFCGLGNPRAFWRSLDQMRQPTLDRLTFDDHQRYSPGDLRRLARHALAMGAESLVTTEKDAMNFCEGCEPMFAGLAVYWLRVEMEIEDEPELLRLLNPDEIRARRA